MNSGVKRLPPTKVTIVLTTYSEKAPALVQTVTPADTTEWVRSKLSGYDVIGMKR